MIKKSDDKFLKAKNDKVVEGTYKVYDEVWNYIMDNNGKDCFQIYIHIKYEGEGKFFVSKICVDKIIKKISRIPVDIDFLSSLLSDDGLYLHASKNAAIYGIDKRLFVISLSNNLLQRIIGNVVEPRFNVRKRTINVK